MGYPIMVDLRNRQVTVVGGGKVATRRVARLLAAGALVRVVSPRVTPSLERWSREEKLELRLRPYEVDDLAESQLVLAATNDAGVNAKVATDASARGIWSNIAGEPERGDFTIPAVARFPCLQLAIHAAGSPALARALRRHLEKSLAARWYRGAVLLSALRPYIRTLADEKRRRHFWKQLVATLPHETQGPTSGYCAWIERAAADSGLVLDRKKVEEAVDRAFEIIDGSEGG